jgi:DNA-binding protein HU-beta
MRKQDLIRSVARQTAQPESHVATVVSAVFDTIEANLAAGNEVAISGFGAFRVVDRPARPGHNPQTGGPLRIGARKSPVFRPGARLKRTVSGRTKP